MVKDKIKNKIRELGNFAAYILYFYDPKHMEAKLKPIYEIVPTITIASTGEIFKLVYPAFYIDGKPVYALCRDFPLSLKNGGLHSPGIDLIEEEVPREAFELEIDENGNEIIPEGGIISENKGKLPIKLEIQGKLILKDYTASELDALLSSLHANKLLRPKRVTASDIIVLILSNALSIVITMLVHSYIIGGG